MLSRGIPTYTFEGPVETNQGPARVRATYYGIDSPDGPNIEVISVYPAVVEPTDARLLDAIRQEWQQTA